MDGLRFGVSLVALAAAAATPAAAQVITDGSLPAHGGEPSVLGTTGLIDIPQALGETRGANLFHSFQQFDVPEAATARFNGDAELANIFARITGDAASRIDGTLESTAPLADLWLINPNGVFFGPTAVVNVPAGLHVTTADEIRFADGSVFSAGELGVSTISSAEPEAFGFLQPNPAGITIDGATITSNALDLRVTEFVGGDVTVDGATISTLNGDVQAIAVAEAATIPFDARGVTDPASIPPGDVAITNSSITSDDALVLVGRRVDLQGASLALLQVSVETPEGDPRNGVVLIALNGTDGTPGAIELRDASIDSLSTGGDSEPIALQSSGTVRLVNATVLGDAFGGSAGDVDIDGGANVEILDGSLVASGAIDAFGNAGVVSIDAPQVTIADSSVFSEAVNAGSSGAIFIGESGIVDEVNLSNATLIASFVDSFGITGFVRISANGAVNVADGSIVSVIAPSEVQLFDAFDAGLLQVFGNEVRITSGSTLEASANTGLGAGRISVFGAEGILLDGADISNATQTSPLGGIVELVSQGDVVIRGSQVTNEVTDLGETFTLADAPQDFSVGNVFVSGRNVTVDQSGLGTSGATGGSAGEVFLYARDALTISNATTIDTSVSGLGYGGAATLLAGDISITDSSISARVLDSLAGASASEDRITQISILGLADEGDATSAVSSGSILLERSTVEADTSGFDAAPILLIADADITVDASAVTSDAFYGAVGDAGDITLNAGGALTVRNASSIFSGSFGYGSAGTIFGLGERIVVSGSSLYSDSYGGGSAGLVRLGVSDSTNSVTITDGAVVNTRFVDGYGITGGIYVYAGDAVTVDGGSSLLSYAQENVPGAAFDQPLIILGANDVTVRDAQLQASAATLQGSGILLLDAANSVTLENTSVLNATSNGTLGGYVRFTSNGDVTLTNSSVENVVQDVTIDPLIYAPRENVDGAIFVSGRNVTIDGGSLEVTGRNGGSAGLLVLEAQDAINVSNGANLDASVSGIGYGGSVRLLGGDIAVSDSSVGAESVGAYSGGSASDARTTEIAFVANADDGDADSAPSAGDVRIDRSEVSSDTQGLTGAAISIVNDGDLSVSASEITSDAQSSASQDAGSIIVLTQGAVAIGDESRVATGTFALNANAGSIDILADTIDVSNSGLYSESLVGGEAGRIQLGSSDVTRTIRLSDTSVNTEFDGGFGRPGQITLAANESIVVENGSDLTLRVNEFAANDATDFTRLLVTAPQVSVTSGARIVSTADSFFGAGTIDILTVDSLTLDNVQIFNQTGIGGDGGRVLLRSDGDISISNARIANDVNGGQTFLQRIIVNAEDTARAEILAQLRSFNSFNIVGVLSDSGSIEILNSDLSTSGSNLSNSGSIGVVSETQDVTITNTRLAAETLGSGQGGAIIVSSADETRLTDSTLSSSAAVSDFQGPRGSAGGAVIRGRVIGISGVRDADVLGGAVVVEGAALDPGAGAGNIFITADERVEITSGADIRAETALAPAGRIEITAQDSILLADSDVTTSVAGGAGDGGDVLIGAPAVFSPVENPDGSLSVVFQVRDGARLPVLFLLESNVTADAQRGAGGNIVFPIAGFVQSANAVVSASSAEGGREGTVTSSQPEADIASALAPLDTGLTETAELVADACAGGGGASSLTAAGRGAEPEAPDRALYVRTIDRPQTEAAKKRPPIAVVCATAPEKRG